MMRTGKPAWNVVRTLLTSGTLHALLISQKEDQRRVETPQLMVQYQPSRQWKKPLSPPLMREWREQ
jgi:hypothetical protein